MGCFSSFAFAYEPKREFNSEQFRVNVVVPFTLQHNATRQGNHDIDDIYDLLYTVFFDASNYTYGALAEIINELYYYDGSSNWSVAELMGMIWGHTNSMHYDTEMIALDASAIETNTRLTNSKLEYVFSAIEDTINIKWYDHNVTYSGVNTDNSNTFLNVNTNSNYFYGHFIFPVDFAQNTPQLTRIFLPINVREFSNSSGYPDIDLEAIYYFNGNTSYELSYDLNYYFENTSNGIYLYIFGFRIGNYGHYSFKISSEYELRYFNDYNGSIYTIPFDTLDYQIIRQAFNSRSQNAANEAISKLADLYASDDYIAAKAAQQEYEDEVLQDFTGSGDGAATKSDKNNLKDTSKALKNGLSTGGSVSNGLSVFDNQSSIWDWFTATTRDNLDTRDLTYLDIPYEFGSFARINTSTGVGTNPSDYVGKYKGTKYIDIHNFDSIKYSRASWPGNASSGLCFYDENRTFINVSQKLRNSSTNGYVETSIDVPNNAYYIRLMFYDPIYFSDTPILQGRYAVRSSDDLDIIDFYNPNKTDLLRELGGNER